MKVCVYCNRKCPDGDITFHKIPSDKERRQKWLNAMKLPDENINKNSYLCSEHFEISTFCCQVVNKVVHRFLHMNAVPSIFEGHHSLTVESEIDLNSLDENISENENSSIQLSAEYNKEEEEEEEEEEKDVDEEEEDCYYYKIENGIIKRYLKNNLTTPSSSSKSEEDFSKRNEKTFEENFNTESKKLANKSCIINNQDIACSKRAPVRVEILPKFQLPIKIRKEEIYLDNNICDLKTSEFDKHKETNLNYENITIDTEEIPFDQIIEFSNVNGLNEVEVTTCESESVVINEQEPTIHLEKSDMKTKDEETNNLPNGILENIPEAEIKNQNNNIPKTDLIDVKHSETQDSCMKNLLYEYLEKNESIDINIKVTRCTKFTLTELLRMVLNYIERLEEKLDASVEKNKQYENQILELKKLLQSSSFSRDKVNFM